MLLHGNMFSMYCLNRMGDISSGCELPLHLFLVFLSGRTDQTFFLEFIKDAPVDNRDDIFVSPLGRCFTFASFDPTLKF